MRDALKIAALLGTLCLFLLPATSAAQITVGIDVGPALSTFTGDAFQDLGESTYRFGGQVGAWVGIPLAGRVSLEPGIRYMQKGFETKDEGGHFAIRLDYIEIPLLLSVELTEPDEAVAFVIYGGPSIARKTKCESEVSSGDISFSDTCDSADDSGLRTFDFGAVLGSMARFYVNDRLFAYLGVGAEAGLRTLGTAEDAPDTKNRAFFVQFGVGYIVGG